MKVAILITAFAATALATPTFGNWPWKQPSKGDAPTYGSPPPTYGNGDEHCPAAPTVTKYVTAYETKYATKYETKTEYKTATVTKPCEPTNPPKYENPPKYNNPPLYSPPKEYGH
ncbi:hypothetical protein TI39_contig285g00005 [Zymoseptoria brevis]|uniref:Uncharacterized protein n=1 Tax=Zymoseptoria brevis TaxID=1047168 RepID=A0A0F4GW18_9PEZI|nr:hypothetical protein TI39_contig285g00005 [Zymoseptoria brevis]